MRSLNSAFAAEIGKRGLTVVKLAEMTFSGRSHLTNVLNGRRAGRLTWKRLARVLSKEEYELAWGFAEAERAGFGGDGQDGKRGRCGGGAEEGKAKVFLRKD